MLSDPNQLLLMLQHGDSFFPSGGLSFSWALEGLCGDDELRGSDALFHFVIGQLRARWAESIAQSLLRLIEAHLTLPRSCSLMIFLMR